MPISYVILLYFSIIILFEYFILKYNYSNRYINYILVMIMVFGHPFYFILSFLIAFATDNHFSGNPLFNHFTLLGYLTLILSALYFAFMRFLIYILIQEIKFKEVTLKNLYEYSSFYWFTFFGTYLYISAFRTSELEFYMVFILQGASIYLVIPVLLYSVIKFLVLKKLLKN